MKTLTGDWTTPRRVSVVSGASVSRQKDGLGAGKEFPEDTYDKTLNLRAMGKLSWAVLVCLFLWRCVQIGEYQRISPIAVLSFACKGSCFCYMPQCFYRKKRISWQ